ncbi:MAG TPA: hypothetical protein VEL07_16010 [Planctomycetota bacterium]|nr:hypothetical protein [Planctomycetota bacterium]
MPTRSFLRAAIAALALTACLGAAEIPKDASKALATYDAKTAAISADAAKAKAKLRKALLQKLADAEAKEERAKRFAVARSLKQAREEIEAAGEETVK